MLEHIYNDELYHHGIEGQKWGVRRFQYEDGSLTPAGKKRYGRGGNYIRYMRGNVKNKQGTALNFQILQEAKKISGRVERDVRKEFKTNVKNAGRDREMRDEAMRQNTAEYYKIGQGVAKAFKDVYGEEEYNNAIMLARRAMNNSLTVKELLYAGPNGYQLESVVVRYLLDIDQLIEEGRVDRQYGKESLKPKK